MFIFLIVPVSLKVSFKSKVLWCDEKRGKGKSKHQGSKAVQYDNKYCMDKVKVISFWSFALLFILWCHKIHSLCLNYFIIYITLHHRHADRNMNSILRNLQDTYHLFMQVFLYIYFSNISPLLAKHLLWSSK